jgi:hypothetical protein
MSDCVIRIILLVVLIVLPNSACEPAVSRDAVAQQSLNVAIHGCDRLIGNSCLRQRAGELRMWVANESSPGALTATVWTAPHEPPIVAAVDVDELGTLLVVTAPLRGVLELRHADGRRRSLSLAQFSSHYLATVDEVKAHIMAGNFDAARKRLAAALTPEAPLEEAERYLLECYEFSVAFNAQDWDRVIDGPYVEFDRRATMVGDAGTIDRLHVQAAFVAIGHHEFQAAQEHLQAVRTDGADLFVRIEADYCAGLLDQRLGLTERALEAFERAARLAGRTGLAGDQSRAEVYRALMLAQLGRFNDARAITQTIEQRLELEQSDEIVANVRFNLAWVEILQREDEPDIADPSQQLDEVVSYYREHERPREVASALLNQAIAASQNHDLDRLEALLAQIDPAQLENRELVYYELVLGRADATAGRNEAARKHLARADSYALLAGDGSQASLRIQRARAELELEAGAVDDARHAFAEAEKIADRMALEISADAGRSSFSTAQRHSRARYLELLLDLDDRWSALCLVLGARARHLRALSVLRVRINDDAQLRSKYMALQTEYRQLDVEIEQQTANSWQMSDASHLALLDRMGEKIAERETLANRFIALLEHDPQSWRCEDLTSAIAEDDALLTMHPSATPGGWWLLLARANQVHALHVPATDDLSEDADRALARLVAGGELTNVRQLTVVPVNEFHAVEFHQLTSVQDSGLQVVYSLGLGPRTTTELGRVAAVVAGSTDGLTQTQTEAQQIERELTDAGWRVERRWDLGDDDQPSLLHFIGHGVYASPQSDLSGWGSYLDLVDGRLTSKDLLVAQRAPAIVVLGACRAGTLDNQAVDGGMNLASAFLLSGAELVIAPTAKIDDARAQAFAAALYAEFARDDREPRDAMVAALARVQARDSAYAAWRAWIR